jgi:hypothetical protein
LAKQQGKSLSKFTLKTTSHLTHLEVTAFQFCSLVVCTRPQISAWRREVADIDLYTSLPMLEIDKEENLG